MNTISIARGKSAGTISKNIYGHFSEHLGRCIYNGLFVGKDSLIPNVNGMRTDVVEALKAKDNVEFVLDSRITALHGEGELTGITVTDKNGNERNIAVDGLFVAIGHAPDNGIFAHLFDLDEGGYAVSDERCLTKTPGVFVAGDCRRKSVRQLTTAVADGSAAALAACSYIDSL